ncbi:MAG: hypothetical protein JW810_12790 [Sedimentisphaerales bacterium]|nr:hypothetical protein [Sedimentisphaerales bacterium]
MNPIPENEQDDPDPDDLENEAYRPAFRDFVEVCPACKRPIRPEMDSCPFCGDILYRYLADSTFAPRKGPLVKIFAVLVVLLVLLSLLGMLLVLLP